MSSRAVPFLDLRAAYVDLKEDIDAAVHGVLDSGWYLLGQELRSFEAEYASYTGAREAIGVANGLDALILSLKALGVGPGDEVIVPANTYIATWLAVSAVGATPVPVEPIPGVWNLDPARIEAALTEKTKALLPVHLFGQPADLGPILEIARRRGLVVVEDAAQSHGASYEGKPIGGHGDAVAWSFYPGKNLGALGDGGAITTNRPEVAERVRLLRNYGSKVKYYNEERGHNSRLDELHAAVLRVKLRALDAWNDRRRAIAKRYLEGLCDVPGLSLPKQETGRTHAQHLFVVDHDRRDELQAHLTAGGVGTLIHYPVPPHLSEAYRDLGLTAGMFPITERAAKTHLSLPMGPHLSDEDVDHVLRVCLTWRPNA